MKSKATISVLIVGGGLTALATALTLAKNGISIRIVQKDDHFHIGQRGAGIQPRTLEYYNLLGVLPDTWERSIPLLPIIPRILGQANQEGIMRKYLEKLGVHVELNTELRTYEQIEHGVLAHTVRKSGDEEIPETIRCDWLVGADGAKGVVRKHLEVTFLGETRADRIILGEVELLKGLSRDCWHMWGVFGGTFVSLRPTETERIFSFGISGEFDYNKMMSNRDMLIQYIRDQTGRHDIELSKVNFVSDWRPSARMVDKFSVGRVFLAGDAAHVHSPTGGQGLNTGIQDGVDLGWKLALVIKNYASPSLLDTYTIERLPVVAHMLKMTTNHFHKTRNVTVDGRGAEEAFKHSGVLKQLEINYRWSPIVLDKRTPYIRLADTEPLDVYGAEGGDASVLRAGDRAPDAPSLMDLKQHDAEPTNLFSVTHHTVLIFSRDVAHIGPVLDALKGYPPSTVKSVAIYPQGTSASLAFEDAEYVMVDRDGHAYNGYNVADSATMTIVIVRPDGVVGGIVFEAEGVQNFFQPYH
ncbi:monooxygenase [Wolfiporia cocos MD-104 SS10]|uniref:Monooxygenase n=1 Tax=Wolfiporia cocos (strain MD-104) TaxID=742152 RepID=A0A2H3J9U3_WOLCO|nr:monooxygenase [Wolfiporia cocos MD-104 SS10]